ncbi:MAG: hypothetical protein WAK01_17115, partial [Methylocystis sp.]
MASWLIAENRSTWLGINATSIGPRATLTPHPLGLRRFRQWQQEAAEIGDHDGQGVRDSGHALSSEEGPPLGGP